MEALNRLPWVPKNPIFKRLSEIGEVSALSREERIKYDAAIRIYHALNGQKLPAQGRMERSGMAPWVTKTDK